MRDPNFAFAVGRQKRQSTMTYDATYTAEAALTEHPDVLIKGLRFKDQAEREIYEGTPWGHGVPMMAHLQVQDTTPRHRRLQVVAKRMYGYIGREVPTREEYRVASHMVEAFRILDADEAVVKAFYRECMDAMNGLPEDVPTGPAVNSVARRWYKLAMEMKKLEPQAPELEPGMQVPTLGSEYSSTVKDGAEATIRHIEELAGDEYLFRFGDPDHHEHMGKTKMVDPEDEEEQTSWMDCIECGDTGASHQEVYRYHRVAGRERDWLTSQPIHYRMLIKAVKDCKSKAQLGSITHHIVELTMKGYLDNAKRAGLLPKAIGFLRQLVSGRKALWVKSQILEKLPKPAPKRVMPSEEIRVDGGWMTITGARVAARQTILNPSISGKLTKDQESKLISFYMGNPAPTQGRAQEDFFWSTYRAMLAQYPATEIRKGSQADKLLTRIQKAVSGKQLGWLAVQMHAFQNGKIAGSKVAKEEWSIIWKAYKTRKGAFAKAA